LTDAQKHTIETLIRVERPNGIGTMLERVVVRPGRPPGWRINLTLLPEWARKPAAAKIAGNVARIGGATLAFVIDLPDYVSAWNEYGAQGVIYEVGQTGFGVGGAILGGIGGAAIGCVFLGPVGCFLAGAAGAAGGGLLAMTLFEGVLPPPAEW
jgi:hypothetical protein